MEQRKQRQFSYPKIDDEAIKRVIEDRKKLPTAKKKQQEGNNDMVDINDIQTIIKNVFLSIVKIMETHMKWSLDYAVWYLYLRPENECFGIWNYEENIIRIACKIILKNEFFNKPFSENIHVELE